jgi:carbamoyl-phosphate synthase small subunit
MKRLRGWVGFLKRKAILAIEDGTVVKGIGFGAERESLGELVFSTAMTGYPESLTDPSFNGQILMSTYPLIGNYNVHPEWFESDRVWVEGFVVKELCEHPSHWKGIKTVDELLEEFDVPGIMGVDTRALTIKIREHGTMKSGLVTYEGREPDVEEFLERVRKQPSISERDLVAETTRKEITHFNADGKFRVVLIDCGVKRNIVRSLLRRGVSVIAVPARASAGQIEELEPDGIVISNAPGDPAVVTYVHRTIKQLMEKYPMMGICAGNQFLALAAGARTFKLKFGHRGGNQPVKDLQTGRVYITSQNHSFAIDPESLEGTGFEVTKINCNDGTVEGIDHKELPIFSVQYHPEDSPGPWDNQYLFDRFIRMIEDFRGSIK